MIHGFWCLPGASCLIRISYWPELLITIKQFSSELSEYQVFFERADGRRERFI